jgi:hypothetical protein
VRALHASGILARSDVGAPRHVARGWSTVMCDGLPYKM